eukprot:TRINITY_DN6065_c0_g1_i1.p1 TRINITY_DN6065_c0_g1~~TRINITY_DN6065_c0_g1_i1.p1  ORF type:complete len:340 (+),score=76.27 TRINITY_DN6065_c0_g1_i1:179-1198(+)
MSKTVLNTNKINPDPIEKHYDMLEDLGKGSFSVVKHGRHRETGSDYAVKIMEKSKVLDKLDVVQVEVEVLSRMADSPHPHIIGLKEIFETDKHYYLVMELITGGELFDSIVELECYTESDASKVIMQLASAIQHLHQHGIIHRDLKPENLLLSDASSQSDIKLADFGLSAVFAEVKDAAHTKAELRKAVGTPGYISPDMLKTLDDPEHHYGIEVDMWSVGVIMYILLCGFPPFYADNDDELFDQILGGKYDLPSPYWDNISQPAIDLLSKLLVLDEKQRYTPTQVLAHPWITSQAPTQHLTTAVEQLKKFNAKRKWRGAMLAAIAIGKMGKLSLGGKKR